MKQKWLFGFLALSTIFVFTAYFIGINHSASQLKSASERISTLEEKLKIHSLELEQELKAQKDHEITLHKEQVDQLKEKIEKLETELQELRQKAQTHQEKKVFLTFDDGPSPLTNQVLDILNQKNVKATFFTIGQMMEQYPDIVKKTYENGHMVLTHSYSHKYSIYSSFDTFYQDYEKVENAYQTILGFKAPPIFRFPGGSSNQSSYKYGGKQFMTNLTTDLRNRGFSYIDWNVISGDATSISKQPNKMLEQVKQGSTDNNFVVALFHDINPNKATVEILPEVIDYYEKNGYTFRTFRDITEEEIEEMKKRGIINKHIVHS
ncbi:hypothetical protein DS745_01330 [Anaerobacillus alkaliphilus]|uniref:NodB homology domain-containing protein n=1 Tax=Anaerobacillus alkaliphilus TaxID=1548597 RepID=A0A4Q0VX38_9BACI|nr:polysaccharide deacetylase family protein [Anaerobacillus alkaliphilus]RXJ04059.1 hypothetical protein DS745_01330 [Anaerobacillus alkaliphilus]